MRYAIAILLLGMIETSAGTGCALPAQDGDDDPAQSAASQPAATCPFQSIQARVQPDIQTPWTRTLTVSPGQAVRMAGFFDGTGLIDTSGSTSLSLNAPTGTSFLPNDTTRTLTATGVYTMTATCGALSQSATIVVQGVGCPYASIQVRVQPNTQTAWTPTLSISAGQRFRVGGFYNGTGMLAPSGIQMSVSGPTGPLSPANGAFVTAPVAGIYTVVGICDTLVRAATVTVE